nr:transposase [Candidatus Levybacteria bacterium]
MLRKDILITGNFYHIFNRGVNKNDIFFSEKNYKRFITTAIHYKNFLHKFTASSVSDTVSVRLNKMEKPKVQILAYCLMPNHFHFLIKQLEDGGITWFMQHLINSYVHYLNVKYKRVGPLFQGPFKNILIDSDEQLLHLSRYIHLNPLVSDLTTDLKKYTWSSYPSYVSGYNDDLSETKFVLENFKSRRDYENFVLDQADYAKSLEYIKHYLLD